MSRLLSVDESVAVASTQIIYWVSPPAVFCNKTPWSLQLLVCSHVEVSCCSCFLVFMS